MLILTRFPEEWIVITLPDGTRFRLQVISARENGKVRLGFEAPPWIEIDRLEIREQKDQDAQHRRNEP